MQAIEIAQTGGPEVLRWVELDDPQPEPDELVVDLTAAGLNYIDTYHRGGLYPLPLPAVLGVEGAGVASAVGANVDQFQVGDRVAWTGVIGSYATKVRVPAAQALPIPDGVETKLAAASMLQGMTAHFLATSTFPLSPGDRCLIHAGAGGVGLLLIQMAKIRQAEVFTTVGTQAKADLVRQAGADHVIMYRDQDFGDAIETAAGSRPLDVIYDGVGADTFKRGLDLLKPRGMMVTFGNASGPVEPVSPLELARAGSIFLTRPTLNHYISSREELEARASDVLGWIEQGHLDIRVSQEIPLANARHAHELIEGRRTTGKVLLVA